MKGKRELIARALGRPAMRSISRALGQPHLLGLTYHRICDYDTLDDGVISASLEEFDWQLSFVKDTVRVLSGEEIVAYVSGALRLDGPALCITFDDGYADNLEAGRILARHGLPAVFFVTTSFIGSNTITHWDRIAFCSKRTDERYLEIPPAGGKGPWQVDVVPRDRAARQLRDIYLSLPQPEHEAFIESIERAAGVAVKDSPRDRPLFMTWEEVRALRELGHEIGAHTHSHPILSKLSPEEQAYELTLSRDTIAREVGVNPRLFAYPNGKQWTFTAETKSLVQRCGYTAAFSFYGGRNVQASSDAYDMRRVWVSPTESRDLFRARISFPQLLA